MKGFRKYFLLIITLTISLLGFSQKWSKVFTDTSVFYIDSAIVGEKKYLGFLKDHYFFLLNRQGDTIIKNQDYFSQFEFKDFDNDGNKDIFLYLASNTPLVTDLYLFDPSIKKFRLVENSDNFPAPEPIKGTKYYYSYHKSGCADLNWDSDLFFIQEFKAIRIGNISGIGCGDRAGKKDGIYISKVRSNKKSVQKTMPIDAIAKYQDHKWGFIKSYWSKNYRLFR